ncbi:MFS transporter [Nocardioides zeae]|uniref:MFS transporter n=1 Tax=Nocardioides imazamoxiresistens TaxID=3231893 RepID=A0ABU3Q1B0_9ACTN|nr:MFS transporter [Nocardioides zeae]MDT9595270.1 MFS transporter [Nocardioides zeae]
MDDRSALAVGVYRRYLASRAVAMAGNALTLVALPVLVYRLTGSATLTALMAAAETAPYLLLGLPAGALVDRWNRRRVLVGAGLGAGLLLATIPLAEVAGALTYPHLLVVGLAVAALFVFADAAAFGVVPQMVGRARVASATSTLVTVGTAISVVGPLVAGVLVAVLPAALVIGVDAACHVVAAAVVARLRWPGSEERGVRTAGATLRTDMVEGLRYLVRQPVVRAFTFVGIGCSLAGGAVAGLVVVVGVELVGLTAQSPRIGWLYAAGAVGTFAASLALPRLQARVGVGAITTAGFALGTAALLLVAGSGGLVVALVGLGLFHLASTTIIVNGIVVRQVVTPDALQSRVNTTARMIAWGGSPLGAALGGVLAGAAGVEWALRAAALALVVGLCGAVAAGVPRFGRLAALTPAA